MGPIRRAILSTLSAGRLERLSGGGVNNVLYSLAIFIVIIYASIRHIVSLENLILVFSKYTFQYMYVLVSTIRGTTLRSSLFAWVQRKPSMSASFKFASQGLLDEPSS